MAVKLHKLSGADRYFWWAVIGLVLQAWVEVSGVATPLGAAKSLQLAESMIARHIHNRGLYDGFEALLLHLDILYSQVKDNCMVQSFIDLSPGVANSNLESKFPVRICEEHFGTSETRVVLVT